MGEGMGMDDLDMGHGEDHDEGYEFLDDNGNVVNQDL